MSSQPDAEKYDVTLGQLGATLAVSPAENEANVAVVEHTLAPHSLAAPLHRHSREDEFSVVLEGEMAVLADDRTSSVGAGEFVVKSRDVWHTFWNAGDEPLRFLEFVAPGGLAWYVQEAAAIVPTGGRPDEETMGRLAALGSDYGLEFDFESVPELLQQHDLRF